MTALELQFELCDEIERILKTMIFKDSRGNLDTMKAYPQELPKRRQSVRPGEIMPEETEDDALYPFCTVRIESGEMNITQGHQRITTEIIFGIFDDDLNRQGHQAILNMIHKITERFTLNPVLNGKYQLATEEEINWILDDEDRFPHYFGAMSLSWNALHVEREDEYA